MDHVCTQQKKELKQHQENLTLSEMLRWHRRSCRFSMDSWSAAFFNLAMYASSSSTLSHVTCTTSPLLLLPVTTSYFHEPI